MFGCCEADVILRLCERVWKEWVTVNSQVFEQMIFAWEEGSTLIKLEVQFGKGKHCFYLCSVFTILVHVV